jgi:hypothetical protein
MYFIYSTAVRYATTQHAYNRRYYCTTYTVANTLTCYAYTVNFKNVYSHNGGMEIQ